ncbi:MAG: YHS domain-containing protein, partial [Nitrososphaerota archaeon]
VKPEDAYSKIEYEGHVIYFCSKKCEEKFKINPKKYL